MASHKATKSLCSRRNRYPYHPSPMNRVTVVMRANLASGREDVEPGFLRVHRRQVARKNTTAADRLVNGKMTRSAKVASGVKPQSGQSGIRRLKPVAAIKPTNTRSKQPPEKFCNLDGAVLKPAFFSRNCTTTPIAPPPSTEIIAIYPHSTGEMVYKYKLIIFLAPIPPYRSV